MKILILEYQWIPRHPMYMVIVYWMYVNRLNSVFVNGRVGNDANVREYTCHTARGYSVVNYLICDTWSMSRILGFEVIDLSQIVSDHCMLTCKMSAKLPNVDQTEGVKTKYVWGQILRGKYVELLSQAQTDLERTIEDLCNTHDSGAIAAGIKNFTDLLQRVVNPLFLKRYRTNKNLDTTRFIYHHITAQNVK